MKYKTTFIYQQIHMLQDINLKMSVLASQNALFDAWKDLFSLLFSIGSEGYAMSTVISDNRKMLK